MADDEIKAVDKDSKIKAAQHEKKKKVGGAEIRYAPPLNKHENRKNLISYDEKSVVSKDSHAPSNSDLDEISAPMRANEGNPISERVPIRGHRAEYVSRSYAPDIPNRLAKRYDNAKTAVSRNDKNKPVQLGTDRRNISSEAKTNEGCLEGGNSSVENEEATSKKYTLKKKDSTSKPRRSGRARTAMRTGRSTVSVASRSVRSISATTKKSANVISKTKNAGERSVFTDDDTPEQYAGDHIAEGEKWLASKGVDLARYGVRRTTRIVVNTAKKAGRQIRRNVKKPVRRHAVKQAGDATVKTAKVSVKTAEYTVKTTEEVARVGTKTAAETTKAVAKASQIAAKAAANSAKIVAQMASKAVQAATKVASAIGQAVASFIAAGGWIIILVALVIVSSVAVVVIVVCSAEGIFAGETDPDTGLSISSAVALINEEYQEKIEEIKDSVKYDIVEITGEPEPWRNVLTIYAVSVATDPDDPRDVATIDEEKLEYLRELYWNMTVISFQLVPDPSETTTVSETTSSPPDPVEPSETFSETEPSIYLYITVSCVNFDDYVAGLDLTERQLEELDRLMSDEYNELWEELLS